MSNKSHMPSIPHQTKAGVYWLVSWGHRRTWLEMIPCDDDLSFFLFLFFILDWGKEFIWLKANKYRSRKQLWAVDTIKKNLFFFLAITYTLATGLYQQFLQVVLKISVYCLLFISGLISSVGEMCWYIGRIYGQTVPVLLGLERQAGRSVKRTTRLPYVRNINAQQCYISAKSGESRDTLKSQVMNARSLYIFLQHNCNCIFIEHCSTK